jgi:arylsulfatase A-like enzyme
MKNVILITIDSLRADHLGCLGFPGKTTPNLDEIARKGILFSQAISNAPYTPVSFRSILSSTSYSMYDDDKYLSKYRTTIQEVLKKKGYHTAAFHCSPYISSYFNFNKGFDTFEDGVKIERDILNNRVDETALKQKLFKKFKLIKLKMEIFLRVLMNRLFRRADEINEMAISWLDNNPGNFFLWVHHMDVHYPYIPYDVNKFSLNYIKVIKANFKFNHGIIKNPEDVSRDDLEFLISLYDKRIESVDKATGDFINKLKERDILKDTMVIITSDHGEEFLEHGCIGHFHGGHLYDELLRVPLIIYAEEIGENIVVRDQVELMSIPPTIIDALGFKKPGDFMGRSLLPVIRGDKGEDYVISEFSRNKISYREPGWKFIYNKETEKYELYDLFNDPLEKQDISQKEPGKVEEIRKRISSHETFLEKEKVKRKLRKLKVEI